jgi:hypothetical protein
MKGPILLASLQVHKLTGPGLVELSPLSTERGGRPSSKRHRCTHWWMRMRLQSPPASSPPRLRVWRAWHSGMERGATDRTRRGPIYGTSRWSARRDLPGQHCRRRQWRSLSQWCHPPSVVANIFGVSNVDALHHRAQPHFAQLQLCRAHARRPAGCCHEPCAMVGHHPSLRMPGPLAIPGEVANALASRQRCGKWQVATRCE